MTKFRSAVVTASLRAAALTLAVSAGVSQGQAQTEWTLYGTVGGTETHLLDLAGNTMHTWASAFTPGASVYLLDEGAILRPANDPSTNDFNAPGLGGRIERIAWDGTVEWSYVAAGPDYVQHHDIELLPNGNILFIAWERYSRDKAIAMGRDPGRVSGEVWATAIYEVKPAGSTGGDIVWVWRVWDHLVQDHDPALPNYGVPADFPGRIDINFGPTVPDWLHANAVDYNEALDQIVVSVRTFSEVWIISHDPADSGDLLYRWGNPQAYGRGAPWDQMLFYQHDPEWIPEGLPGAGNLTIFNNGDSTIRPYSSIDELDTGVRPDGSYDITLADPFGPSGFTSSIALIDGQPFFSQFMSGVQRLPNGNSLVCSSMESLIFEVDETGSTVWAADTPGPAFRATRFAKRDPRLEGLLWCVADFNEDDTVDALDFLAFLNAWAAGEPDGDFDGNGTIDTRDVLAFLDAWASGCG